MDYGKLTVGEIKNGYRFADPPGAYVCVYCGESFNEGQVYSAGNGLYSPERAAARHAEDSHGDRAARLVSSDTKYNTLTENQKELLLLMNSGLTDAEIAKKTGVTPSTVRRHKFNFREKAKQAKLYLACFESVFEGRQADGEAIVPIHNRAKFYDDRYVTTESERAKILETSFASLDPPVLKNFPSKEKKKIVVLAKIAELFEPYKKYTEKEVSEIIKPVYEDYAVIRRFMVIYGFMEREGGGKNYWLTE